MPIAWSINNRCNRLTYGISQLRPFRNCHHLQDEPASSTYSHRQLESHRHFNDVAEKGLRYMTKCDRRTVRCFYDAVIVWNLDDTDAGILIGVSPQVGQDWKV